MGSAGGLISISSIQIPGSEYDDADAGGVDRFPAFTDVEAVAEVRGERGAVRAGRDLDLTHLRPTRRRGQRLRGSRHRVH